MLYALSLNIFPELYRTHLHLFSEVKSVKACFKREKTEKKTKQTLSAF